MSRTVLISWIYFALAAVGTLLSWLYVIDHFQEANSILIGPFLKSATATPASTGVAIDAYFSGIVFSIMVVTRAAKERVKWPWFYVAICFLVGLCLALPLYLGMRERALMDSKKQVGSGTVLPVSLCQIVYSESTLSANSVIASETRRGRLWTKRHYMPKGEQLKVGNY